MKHPKGPKLFKYELYNCEEVVWPETGNVDDKSGRGRNNFTSKGEDKAYVLRF